MQTPTVRGRMDLTEEELHEIIKLMKEVKDTFTSMKDDFKKLFQSSQTLVLEEKLSQKVNLNYREKKCEVKINFSEDVYFENIIKVRQFTSDEKCINENQRFIKQQKKNPTGATEGKLPDRLSPKTRPSRSELYNTDKKEFNRLTMKFSNVLTDDQEDNEDTIFDPGGR